MSTEALAALAGRLGIAPGYHDIWGGWHPLEERTLHALLGAAGHDVSGGGAERALAAVEAAHWRRALPPVRVVPVGESVALPLVLPAERLAAPLGWRLEEEGGAVHTGEVPALEATAERLVDGVALVRATFHVPAAAGAGYHTVRLTGDGAPAASTRLIVVPRRCHQPTVLEGGARVWGVAIQLYGLRSRRNWGIGDFTDLAAAVDVLAGLGADLVGVNPLHALYPHRPADASPYSPSSRSFLNVLYLDVEAVPDHAASESGLALLAEPSFRGRIEAARAAELVDYPAVAALKLEALRHAFAAFRRHHLDRVSPRGEAFRAFQRRGGEALRSLALFDALAAHRGHDGELPPHDGPEVAAFLAAHEPEVEFREYLQWQCATQLDAVARRARDRGMGIGLYLDLAVGAHRRGAEVWGEPGAFAAGVSTGAPPDDFSLSGQSWGLPPWRPDALAAAAYEPYIRTLRAAMASAGALRVDHVVGLMRLFWVPEGTAPLEGAYVAYPLADLLGILALESERQRCLVVGEDLGTVPDQVRAALHEHGVLSYRVLYFEKHWHGDHSFLRPHEMPADALATVSTHDLPTFAGFWSGADLALRDRLGLLPGAGDREALERVRGEDRHRLLWVLGEQGLRPDGVDPARPASVPESLGVAVQRYLARSSARLMTVQMEDVLGLVDQANLPGTIAEQPNWRRRLPLAVEDWACDPRLVAHAAAVGEERP